MGGSLSLTQDATAGAGGSTDSGVAGAGGTASSGLTFTDATGAAASTALAVTVTATGGMGGGTATGTTGAGGSATAKGTITGTAATESLLVNATGGAGGQSDADTYGAGGVATATATLTGSATSAISDSAIATNGFGNSFTSSATATGTGGTGTVSAQSGATFSTAGLGLAMVDSAGASASSVLSGNGTVADSANDVALVQQGYAMPSLNTGAQGLAVITDALAVSDLNTVLTNNAAIKSAFAVSPSYFALAQLGGRYSTAGNGKPETVNTSVNLSVDLAQVASVQDLLIGFYGGTVLGTGVTGVTLNVVANGTTLLTKSFSSGAAAQTWFTNNAVDLGSLTGSLYSGGVANLTVSLSVTTTSAGSGFYGQMLIGDPPPAATTTPKASPFDAYAHLLGSQAIGGTTDGAASDTMAAANLLSGVQALHHANLAHAMAA